jgi:hemerythrin-like domain-containing protein
MQQDEPIPQEYTMSADAIASTFDSLDACHRDIGRHLESLQALARHLEDQGVDNFARAEAGRIEAFFSGTSRQHHADEEQKVFPPLLSSGDADLVHAVRRLQQDHGWIEENWIELAPRLRAIAEGIGWADPVEIQAYIQVFGDLLVGHIALEESLIYPEAKARWQPLIARRRDAVVA